jgi:DNA-directed RNA polymerase specialized sigma24 family protein
VREFVGGIAGQAEEQPNSAVRTGPFTFRKDQGHVGEACSTDGSLPGHEFPEHDFMKQRAGEEPAPLGDAQSWDQDPNLWLYRKKTTALLGRYMRWSLAAGRVPSLLGRELFRARISAYTATTFEARVIFLHDVEICLDRLQSFDRQMIARIVLQGYDHEAASRILQCDRKTIERRLPELIDELSEAFLKAELLERLPETHEEAL